MERMIKTFACLAGLVATTAYGSILEDWSFKPILGADLNARAQKFEPGFGDDHFRRHYPDTNLYAGIIMNKYLGLEGGYERTYELEKKQFYNTGATVLGTNRFLLAGLEDMTFSSNSYMQGWHLNLVGLWPVCENIALTASVGAAWVRMYFETTFIADNDAASRPTQWHSDDRAVARVTLGIRQMITKHFGVRVQGAWENTDRLEATIPVGIDNNGAIVPSIPSDNYTVRPKDSYTLGLGFFLQLG